MDNEHTKEPKKKEIRTSLRLPDELKTKLQDEADRQHRSMHNLMVSILWDYFD